MRLVNLAIVEGNEGLNRFWDGCHLEQCHLFVIPNESVRERMGERIGEAGWERGRRKNIHEVFETKDCSILSKQ
jgi:hypothetical protein